MLNLAISLLTLMAIGTLAQMQPLTLFSEKGCRGFYLKIAPTNSIINLENSGFNNTAQSALRGESWLFYNETYLNNLDGAVEFIYDYGVGCHNFRHLSKRISSLRLASQIDQHKNMPAAISFYPKPNFYGTQYYFPLASSAPINYNVASIVITGQSPWTIYGQTDYTGPALCLHPEDSTGKKPTLIPDIKQMETPVNYNFIKSFTPGCKS